MFHELSGPDVLEWLGVRYKTILSASETGGAMSIVDSLSPAGSSPPRHVHQRKDEAFILFSGECEFWLEGQTFTRRAGETAFVSRGARAHVPCLGKRAVPSSVHPHAWWVRGLLCGYGRGQVPHPRGYGASCRFGGAARFALHRASAQLASAEPPFPSLISATAISRRVSISCSGFDAELNDPLGGLPVVRTKAPDFARV
jgi:quercetin dioxygenase-like cupin family protein